MNDPARLLSFGVVTFAALVGLAALVLFATLAPRVPEPGPADFRAARDVIQKGFADGDGIRIHPFWLRDSGAVVGTVKSDRRRPDFVDVSVPPDPMFAARHRRLWIVSAMGRTDAPVPAGAALTFEQEVAPGLRVERYDLGPSPIVLDLLELLRDARVERRGPGMRPRTCTWSANRHRCNGQPWEDVAISTKEVGGAPRRCIVLHPYPDRGAVTVTWPAVELSAWILIRSGLTLDSARNERGSESKLTVLLDGKVVAGRTIAQHQWDFADLYVETARAGEKAAVSIEVTAHEEDFREVCVDGYLLASRPAEAE